jgi:two-component system, NarL family, response regulator LiaR
VTEVEIIGGGAQVSRIIRFLIVEDLEVVSLGLKLSLEAFDDLHLVGSARDGEEAVDMALSLEPDLIIMDIGLPKLDGIAATKKICQALPNVKVLIHTSREKPRDILACFGAGASGYLRKETSTENLFQAIETLVENGLVIETQIAARIVQNWPALAAESAAKLANRQPLKFSQQEAQLLALMAEGLKDQDICHKLGLDAQGLHAQKLALKQSLAALGSQLLTS